MTISPLYHNVRPEGDLLPQEAAAFDLLEQLGIEYDRVSSESADTMEKCAAISEVIGVPVCKNLFLCNRQKTVFYLLLTPGGKRFKTSVVSKLIGSSRLSFGEADMLHELLGVQPGSITPLGLAFDTEHRVNLLIDKDVLTTEEVGMHPLVNTASIARKTEDLLQVFFKHTGHEPRILEIPEETEE